MFVSGDRFRFAYMIMLRNWNEQSLFDAVNTVDPSLKRKGFVYERKREFFFNSKQPPMLDNMPSKYQSEYSGMSRWHPLAPALSKSKRTHLPSIENIRDPLGKPIVADTGREMFSTISALIGQPVKVRLD